MKYHINPKTGRAGQCKAIKEACPLGGDTPHFESKKEAQEFIAQNAAKNNKTFTTIKKNNGGSNLGVTVIDNPYASIVPFASTKIVTGKINGKAVKEESYREFGFTPESKNDYDTNYSESGPTALQKRNSYIKDFVMKSRVEIDSAVRLYAESRLKNNSDKSTKELKQSFSREVKVYSSTDAAYLNSLLTDKHNGVDIDGEEEEILQNMLSNLRPLTYGKNNYLRILHRGLDANITKKIIDGREDIAGEDNFIEKYFPLGKSIKFPTYISTTASENEALEHADKAGNKNGRILLHIMTPRGVNVSSASYHPDEMEVILDRDSHFMVVGRKIENDTGIKTIRIFLVETDEENNII